MNVLELPKYKSIAGFGHNLCQTQEIAQKPYAAIWSRKKKKKKSRTVNEKVNCTSEFDYEKHVETKELSVT